MEMGRKNNGIPIKGKRIRKRKRLVRGTFLECSAASAASATVHNGQRLLVEGSWYLYNEFTIRNIRGLHSYTRTRS